MFHTLKKLSKICMICFTINNTVKQYSSYYKFVKNVLNECITDEEVNNMLQDNVLCNSAAVSVMYRAGIHEGSFMRFYMINNDKCRSNNNSNNVIL